MKYMMHVHLSNGLLSHTRVNKQNALQNFSRTFFMNLKITYKTNNTLECLLTQQHNKHHNTDQEKFQKSGIYHWCAKTVTRNIPDELAVPFIRDSKSISKITNIIMENLILHSTSLTITIHLGP